MDQSIDARPATPSRLTRARRLLTTAPFTARLGMVLVAIYAFVAIFAPWIAPYGEVEVVSRIPFDGWSAQHLLGTDQLGRDFLSRLIFGARNSISIALVTTMISFGLGCLLGVFSALIGGFVDQAISRFVDALMSVPDLIFILMILSIFGNSIPNLILIIAVLTSTRFFRISRAAALNVASLDFVEAARVRGESLLWISVHEVFPNVLPLILSELGMRFCFIFLSIAALSFLGVGIQPPLAEWGSMVRDNAALINMGDITPLIPAASIALLAIAVNFVVDWLLNRASGLNEEG
ncbi:ABC transporter permease subunit [Rhodobacter sphaeroides]|jgi:ABC-type dipeptide/oligopeptide/nickel transport systems, permease components|uniref:ABC peptide transporter, inner membrane subunit n=1 Tax=Cereibacter sphaeroides (strain ATCC 17023 / DSM 158 / JCM 6121 / CCUG 31486 / LMG 2827 / NBRC 12203 / NCIMB 8253 / ATH 2.4.1.) TaxID=272943 RepID=Q3IWG0_CERS4|nr:ABC transporter permease [Cereibacter sphaeroides]ABA81124.1 ABC peptide transporter, inner membrane subunit [Cereibacter sphaeroides 2.4.1]AMJ49433.1 ABC transporter permease [Cereibacter sphaeroides]ANS36145.1 ABC transporter permease [Cereibacter sphaeroides]ATN65211.1 ABC transporter permease [Cereibacter sphaeroides]AXC63417.1 ABC transporter permease [Cereibacter sphaeroides 2.4.1]